MTPWARRFVLSMVVTVGVVGVGAAVTAAFPGSAHAMTISKPQSDLEKAGYDCGGAGSSMTICTKQVDGKDSLSYCDKAGTCEHVSGPARKVPTGPQRTHAGSWDTVAPKK